MNSYSTVTRASTHLTSQAFLQMPVIPSLRRAERRGSLGLTDFQASQDATPGLGRDSVSKV